MINVTRPTPPPSLDLTNTSSNASRERDRATDWYLGGAASRQQHFAFRAYKAADVKDALETMFHGKCAYCESRMGATQPIDIEQYRPKSAVAEAQDHPGYWWLAMDWSNLLASCIDCNRRRQHGKQTSGKANRFPLLDEGRRAYQPGDEANEAPLILDPTRDQPEDVLIYEAETGVILGESERAVATVEVIGLNRPALVAARLQAARSTIEVVERAQQLAERLDRGDDSLLDELQAALEQVADLTRPDEEYAGLKRQIVRSFNRAVPDAPEQRSAVTKRRTRAAKQARQEFLVSGSQYTLDTKQGREQYRKQARAIEHVSITNVRAIKDLDLDLIAGGAGPTHWLTLLGENGTGKSTVLQCIALTLIGAKYFVELATREKFEPSDFIRRRCHSATIEIKITGFADPHRLVFRRGVVEFHDPNEGISRVVFDADGPRIDGEAWPPQIILLAYGATRLLSSDKHETVPGGDYARVENLFDPFQPLYGADWASRLRRKEFDEVAIVIKDLLSLSEEAILEKSPRGLLVNEHGERVPVRHLSDGYQTIVALAADILEVVSRVWSSFESAEGIVLIDEIGAHLHPTWKMRIVESLRTALPGMQFIVTTHQPLCLRGLEEHEVVVMRRRENDLTAIEVITDLPSPAEFRVDQLLTSEFFGLNSTSDPGLEALFDEYYALRAMAEGRNADQDDRLADLTIELKDKRHLGTTLRDNLMYEAVDQIVANQLTEDRLPLVDAKQAAIDQVSAIWNSPIPESGENGPR